MRHGWFGLASAALLASTMATNGCIGDYGGGAGTDGNTGGAPNGNGGCVASGGNQQPIGTGGVLIEIGGAPASCDDVIPCGGDVVGTWTVTSSCLIVTGDLDVSLIGMSCPSLPVTGFLQVGGTWTANPDGTVSDNTATVGTEQFTLAPACLEISSTPVDCAGAASVITALGYSSVDCAASASGGCDCSATVEQSGAMGLVSYLASPRGTYTTSDDVLTTNITSYSYCVSGNTLTITPQTTTPTTAGTVVLQNDDGSGSGGITGSGGESGAGGTTGGGGQTSSGGTTGDGGQTSSGGATGGGGQTSSGGAAGSAGEPGAGGSAGSAGEPGTGGSAGSTTGPCDIYAAASNPCVAAHSTVRALYGSYAGSLYQVERASDNARQDIGPLSPGGVADSSVQDSFCSGTTCIMTVLYDQSGNGNDVWYQGSEHVPASPVSTPANATSESLQVDGNRVYSLYIEPSNCYWRDGSQSGMPLGAEPEGMYMVTSGTHANSGCCFDYGNSETSRSADGAGTMDAINFSTTTAWGSGAGSGPWIMADLEWGLFAQDSYDMNPNNPSQTAPYVTAVLKNNGTTEFALRGSDATTGSLSTYYKGPLPGGWSPMQKQGAITLGCGGDCCKPDGGANLSAGTFYEGAIVTGYPLDETEDAVQANIVNARYGQ